MPTVRQEIETKIANLDAAYNAEKSKLTEELVAIGPLVEHEVESLKSWVAALLKHFGG